MGEAVRPIVDEVVLNLPEPSATRLTRPVDFARRATTARLGLGVRDVTSTHDHELWKRVAGQEVLPRVGRVRGPFSVIVQGPRHPRDTGVLEGAVLELIRTKGLVDPDAECRVVSIEKRPAMPPRRVLVTIQPAE